MVAIEEKELRELYENQGITDKEIANRKGVDRTYISQLRKKWGIYSRPIISDKTIPFAISKLQNLGFKVENVKENDKTANYDLLLDDKIRLDIRSTSHFTDREGFKFMLTDTRGRNYSISDTRIRLANGKTKKVYRKTCDYLVCIGILDEKFYCWVVPPKDLKDSLQSLSLNPYVLNSKYEIYAEAWHLIK